MIRRVFKDYLITVKRILSRPLCRPLTCMSDAVQKPVVKQAPIYNVRFICSRFNYIGKYGVFLKSAYLFGLQPKRILPFCLTVRNNSTSQECNSQPEEQDELYKWIELRCKGHDDAVLDSYETFVTMAAKELEINIESVAKPKRKIQKLTLLKSRHIYKKHRVQYEMRTHFRVITLKHLTGSTADVFLEYIERNVPEGVAMQVKKCHLETMPSHLTPPDETADTLGPPSSSSDSSSDSDLSSDEGKTSSSL